MSDVTAPLATGQGGQNASWFKAGPVFLALLAMGFADAAGPFVGLARQQFRLSNFTAQLIAFAGFIVFGVLSVPVGVFHDRKGAKFILVLGFSTMLMGMLIPFIFGLTTFPFFLLTVLIPGAGATVLQVAGRPLMREVSPEGKWCRNPPRAPSVKAIGSMAWPVFPVLVARAFEWS